MSNYDPKTADDLQQRLVDIEQEMRLLGLWAVEAPSPSALASEVPFCFDTLFFHEWLQWVFLPRMTELLDRGRTPPAATQVAPLAEHSFLDLPQDTDRLLQLIEAFDAAAAEAFS